MANKRFAKHIELDSVVFVFAGLLLVLVIASVPLATRGAPFSDCDSTRINQKYCLFVSIAYFNESTHALSMSFYFRAQLPMSPALKPGAIGIDLSNLINGFPSEDFKTGHFEANGSFVSQGIARWTFSNDTEVHGYGAEDFLPYDAWNFNFTLTTPFLFSLNSSNVFFGIQNYALPGWQLVHENGGKGTCLLPPSECYSLGQYYGENAISFSFRLVRTPFSTLTIEILRYLPLVILAALSALLVMEPRLRLPTYFAVVLACLLFVYTFSTNLPARQFGPSYAEAMFTLTAAVAGILFVATLLESLVFGRSQGDRLAITSAIQLVAVATVVIRIIQNANYFQNLVSPFYWIVLPITDLLIFPALIVCAGLICNVARAFLLYWRA